jgi:hypothetical protein
MAGYRRLMVGLAVAALAAGSGSGARGMQADTERTGPGGVQLLPGYQHRRGGFLDTRSGEIWKPGGPRIQYDIGPEAGNKARRFSGSSEIVWFKTQIIGSLSFEVVMKTNSTLIATFSGVNANFEAQNIHSTSDLADVLLMCMSFDPKKGLREH